jgi:putative nucleotidyltransferase with HDIG domain
MRIATELRLTDAVQNELYYALLLKDVGWTNSSPLEAGLRLASQQERHTRKSIALRCEKGGILARLMGLPEQTAIGIGALYEHWNGYGNPAGLKGEHIPITSRIMLLAQTLDVLFTSAGPDAAIAAIAQRNRRWFDPDTVKAARSLAARKQLWTDLSGDNLPRVALQMEPGQKTMTQGQVTFDAICRAFAAIVDAKSPFTYNHSTGVANTSVAMAKKLDLANSRILFIRHAALLHDLGKMAVPNTILQKPGKLNEAEWRLVRSHPEHTWRILHSIRGFEEMSEVAASHHERLDGSGYFRGLTAPQLSLEARIVAVADIFDALSAKRPYRDAVPLEKVFTIIRKESAHAFDRTCIEALEQSVTNCNQTFAASSLI